MSSIKSTLKKSTLEKDIRILEKEEFDSNNVFYLEEAEFDTPVISYIGNFQMYDDNLEDI